jgi:S-adenosyl-L-methionine hydrolase (adenosine-forming)
MSRPILALLTDFGVRDHYVGVMKAAALSVCPDVTIVDISHEIAPHDVLDGALQLAASFKYFPPGTVFVAVVDPGVGSARRGLGAECGDHRFIAPDNGVLTAVFREAPPKRVVELTERRYFRPTVCRTFEGRDRFAPAAAWLLKGVDLSALGRPAAHPVLLDLPLAQADGDALSGRVLRCDRFGNVITTIDRKTFEAFVQGRPFSVEVAGCSVARLVGTYTEIGHDEVCALFGSADLLELASRSARASDRLEAAPGAPVTVTRA